MCMKKVLMSMTMLFALGCFAQTSGQSSTTPSQSTPSSSNPDTMSPSSGASQGGYGSQTPSSQAPSTSTSSTSESKGKAKTIQGCIAGSSGNFMLQEKGGKSANLQSSQDLSAHVGHEVKVHGHWASASDMAGSAAQSAGTNPASDTASAAGKADKAAANGGKTFVVDSLDMVSEQCKSK
jgi:hypothetical protein